MQRLAESVALSAAYHPEHDVRMTMAGLPVSYLQCSAWSDGGPLKLRGSHLRRDPTRPLAPVINLKHEFVLLAR